LDKASNKGLKNVAYREGSLVLRLRKEKSNKNKVLFFILNMNFVDVILQLLPGSESPGITLLFLASRARMLKDPSVSTHVKIQGVLVEKRLVAVSEGAVECSDVQVDSSDVALEISVIAEGFIAVLTVGFVVSGRGFLGGHNGFSQMAFRVSFKPKSFLKLHSANRACKIGLSSVNIHFVQPQTIQAMKRSITARFIAVHSLPLFLQVDSIDVLPHCSFAIQDFPAEIANGLLVSILRSVIVDVVSELPEILEFSLTERAA
jgi:hypothetical protein